MSLPMILTVLSAMSLSLVATMSADAAPKPMAAPAAAASRGLPKVDGTIQVSGLAAPVTVARDRYGIPEITGESFLDVVRAQGFVHAQDRFFQMDATRRLAAGELSEIVGSTMLEMDQRYRRYRFRSHAVAVIEGLAPHERELLRAYAEGVNAGLASLTENGGMGGAGAPPEYGMLNVQPQPWREEDSILAVFAMFDMLHMEQHFEKRLGVMRDVLPKELYEFLTPIATRFDAPLIVDVGNPHDWTPMPIPGPEVIDLRGRSAADIPDDLVQFMDLAPGSNNWAVAGFRSAHGGAILANDPHLQLTVPGIWYRIQLRWNETSKRQNVKTSKDSTQHPEPSTARRLGGISLPGLPGIVIGSSEHIAWGFTNTMGDFQDLIIIEVHPDDPNLYRTPDGYEPFEEVTETINVRGRPAETLTLRKTRWGIVTDTDHRGRPLVLKWTALERDTIDLGMLDMLHARTIEDAVDVARRWAGPSQNILIASHDGRIAWVVSGYLPDRFGPPEYDGRYPVSWADGDKGWRGPIPEEERPVIIDPEDGVLFTANNRTVGIDRARRLGGIWTAGERASRIGEMLSRERQFDESDLFEMQLDTRVRVFDFYRDLALESMNGGSGGGLRGEVFDDAKDIVTEWNGTADAEQPAMRLLHTFRRVLHSTVIAPLVAPCREAHAGFHYSWFMEEEPVRRILEERPAHLLPPGYSSWAQLIERAWAQTVRQMSGPQHADGLRTRWGEANRAIIAHPITQAMPAFARSLNMPETPQSGHGFAVRVAGPSFGASARMVVSPGRESQGILHTPVGQSGHFQSPHYRDLHRYWVEGLPLPFLPGEATAALTLVPASN